MAFDGQVLSINTTANRIDRKVELGATASSVAVGGNRIWATAGAAAGDHRGGTLRISLPFVESLDPGFAYGLEWQIISLTNDGRLPPGRRHRWDDPRPEPRPVTAPAD